MCLQTVWQFQLKQSKNMNSRNQIYTWTLNWAASWPNNDNLQTSMHQIQRHKHCPKHEALFCSERSCSAAQLSGHQQNCFGGALDLPPQASISAYKNILCRNPWWFTYLSRNWRRVEVHSNYFCCSTYPPCPLMCEISMYFIIDAIIFFINTFSIHTQLTAVHLSWWSAKAQWESFVSGGHTTL